MNLPEILANEELRQHEFPVTKNKIFLAHAAVCALPGPRGEGLNAFNVYGPTETTIWSTAEAIGGGGARTVASPFSAVPTIR